jgi:hypothetical protein
MIAGAEGLALIPALPLFWLGSAFLAIGLLSLVLGPLLRFWGIGFGRKLTKIGAVSVGIGAIVIAPAVLLALKLKSDLAWHPMAVRKGTYTLAFDLRTARTFDMLGLSKVVEGNPSPINPGKTSNHVSIGGDITLDMIVNDRIHYRGKADSVYVADDTDYVPQSVRQVVIVLAPQPISRCIEMARAFAPPLPKEQDLADWSRGQTRELSIYSPANQQPNIALFLKDPRASPSGCVAELQVLWEAPGRGL